MTSHTETAPTVPLETDRYTVARLLKGYFVLDCAECILRTYVAQDESFQVLSTLVDYGYLEYAKQNENYLTQLLCRRFPGTPWEYPGTDYGVTQDVYPVASFGTRVPSPLDAPSTRTQKTRRSVFFLMIPWSRVSRKVAFQWYSKAATLLGVNQPFLRFPGSEPELPPTAADLPSPTTEAPEAEAEAEAGAGAQAEAEVAHVTQWHSVRVLSVPITYNRRVWGQREKAAQMPWVTVVPHYVHARAIGTAKDRKVLAQSRVPSIVPGSSNTACNALYHPHRIVLWPHGEYNQHTPVFGSHVTDHLPSEITIVSSGELVGEARYHQWCQWNHDHESYKERLTGLALAAVVASTLILPEMTRQLSNTAPDLYSAPVQAHGRLDAVWRAPPPSTPPEAINVMD